MYLHAVPSVLFLYFFCVLGIDDSFFVNGEGPKGPSEMLEQGKLQYQILQERGKLPKYGPCWTQAVEHIEEGCRALTEDTQSDIALHMTNCFLEMSGHDTYNCVMDKKPNLRAICVNGMTDRAFNVYMEFYTHTQNMCWFLRGQLWQETIMENTQRVGKQLKSSAKNQEALLVNQRESLEVQEKIMKYGAHMEHILGGFIESAKDHQEIIRILSETVANLQSWLMGEISWLDSVLFYITSSVFLFFFTSTPRTFSARLPTLSLLTLNLFVERFLCYNMDPNSNVNITVIHLAYYQYVWYLRYVFISMALGFLIYSSFRYKDYLVANNLLLEEIKEKVNDIGNNVKPQMPTENGFRYIRESSNPKGNDNNSECSDISLMSPHFENRRKDHRKRTPLIDIHGRYNLRSRQGTPDSTVIMS